MLHENGREWHDVIGAARNKHNHSTCVRAWLFTDVFCCAFGYSLRQPSTHKAGGSWRTETWLTLTQTHIFWGVECWAGQHLCMIPECRQPPQTCILPRSIERWWWCRVKGSILSTETYFFQQPSLSTLNQLDSEAKLLLSVQWPPTCEVSLWSQVQLIVDITKPPLP